MQQTLDQHLSSISSLSRLNSKWYQDIANIQNDFAYLTHQFYQNQGFKTLNFPLIVDSPTCQAGFGSDSKPVYFFRKDNNKYLSDSMQFLLEFSCRLFGSNCYCLMPSFRDEKEDNRHLFQYYHSEAEIIGDMDDAIKTVEQYIKFVSQGLLERHSSIIKYYTGSYEHLEDLCSRNSAITRIKFDDALRLIGQNDYECSEFGDYRRIKESGEKKLIEIFGGFVWITEFDTLAVPFFQSFLDGSFQKTKSADLLFGFGEAVGLGERHLNHEDLVNSLELHKVDPIEYEWYIQLKKLRPLKTSGFGMGVERYLCWLFNHNDVQDFVF